MRDSYELIVIGSGPAGAVAAQRAAAAGVATLLLDRRQVIGEPVRCGELIRRASLAPFAAVDGPWVRSEIDGFRLVAPDRSSVGYHQPQLAVLLDRTLFDQELARRADAAGAELQTGTEVVDLVIHNRRLAGVYMRDGRRMRKVRAELMIAADGVASRMARLAGLATTLPADGLASTVSATLELPAARDLGCELHFGRRTAPGGYLWVFPRSQRVVSIGVGVRAPLSGGRAACFFLQQALVEHFPEARVVRTVAGGIPVHEPSPSFSAPGLLLVGDAARQANPLTGAGIFTAMSAGAMAGEAAAAALQSSGSERRRALHGYERCWRERFGRFHQSCLQARRRLDLISDQALSSAARELGNERPFQSVAHSIMELTTRAEECPESMATDTETDHRRSGRSISCTFQTTSTP